MRRVRILLWHGYLLGGTGSNVYTRALAREWSRMGHEVVVVCQERHPELVRPRRRARSSCPTCPAVCCRCSSSTSTRGCTRSCSRTSRRTSSTRMSTRTRPRFAQLLPADVVFTNHVLLGGAVGAALGAPFAVKVHGSELEYSMRGNERLSRLGGGVARRRARGVRRLGAHPQRARGRRRSRRPRARGAARRRRRRVRARAARRCARRADRGVAPRPGRRRRAPSRCQATRSASRVFFADETPTVLYFGKLIENKGVQVLFEALHGLDARAVVVGFGDYREDARGARTARHALHRCARAPASRPPSAARRRRRSSRRSSPRRSAWSRRRRPPRACRRSSPITPGSPRSRRGSPQEYPADRRAARLVPDRGRRRAARAPARAARAAARGAARARARRARARWSAHWGWSRVAERLLEPFAIERWQRDRESSSASIAARRS